jgi:hypothetical protein
VNNSKFARFVPEIAMPAEKQIFQQLKNDPAISGSHQRYRLWLNDDGTKAVEWITSGPLDASVGWKKIMAWTPSVSATSATFESREYGFFDGKYKLSPTEPVYRTELIGDADETAPFNSVGLEAVWTGGDSYGKSLLEVLDSIKNSREGSPLFRAYLILRLSDLMALQPNAWGLAFCPSLRTHDMQLKSVVGGQLNSGDWFVSAKVNACSVKLEQFFDSTRDISYVKQAGGLLVAARTVSKEGLQYVGFIGLDGKPNYINGAAAGEVWGYSLTRKQPVLLANPNGGVLNEPAVPLSPLFALTKPRKEYLTAAGVDTNDASFQGVLPPLFNNTTRR